MKYRKKPVVIDAELYHIGLEDGWTFIEELDKGIDTTNLIKAMAFEVTSLQSERFRNRIVAPFINTLEGRHYISKDDYIITGVNGERYPCKNDIFHLSYERVDD